VSHQISGSLGRGRRARVLPIAVLLVGGALLSACGAGQKAETTQEFTTITPANAETSDRTISIRAARLELQGSTARGYLSIVNGGRVPDTLIGASSDEASSVTLTREANFMASTVPSLPIPVGARVDLAPGGSSLLLSGLKTPLRAGEVVRVTLSFASASSVTLGMPVESGNGAVIQPSTTGSPSASASASASPAASPAASY